MSEVKAKNTASGEDKNSPRLPATHTCTLIYSLANTLLLLAHTCLTHKALSLPASTHLRSCCLLRKNSKWESIRFDDMYVKETEEGWSRMLYKLNRRKGWKVNLSFGGNGRRFFQWSNSLWETDKRICCWAEKRHWPQADCSHNAEFRFQQVVQRWLALFSAKRQRHRRLGDKGTGRHSFRANADEDTCTSKAENIVSSKPSGKERGGGTIKPASQTERREQKEQNS